MNARAIPVAIVFAVTYAIVYLLAVWHNYALFTYHPVLGEIGWGVEKSRDGPAMYWYGWMSTAALAAIAASVLACLLPASLLQRLWTGWTWVVASGVLVAIAYMLRNYFLR
jgi:hypothetical protein